MIPELIAGTMLGYYTKYDKLKELSEEAFAHVATNQLYIAIDVNNILYRISKVIKSSGEIVSNTTPRDIALYLINMCGHYRQFYNTSYGVQTKFYLVMNTTMAFSDDGSLAIPIEEEQKICAEYAPQSFTMEMHSLILSIKTELTGVVPYLPEVYLVDVPCSFNTAVYTTRAYLQMNDPQLTPIVFMVISKSTYTYALCQHMWMLRPKKYRGEDNSYIISPHSPHTISAFFSERNLRRADDDFSIDAELLLDIMAIHGAPEKGFKSLMPVSRTIKTIRDYYTYLARCQDIRQIRYLLKSAINSDEGIQTYSARVMVLDPSFMYHIIRVTAIYTSITESITTSLFNPIYLDNLNNSLFGGRLDIVGLNGQ